MDVRSTITCCNCVQNPSQVVLALEEAPLQRAGLVSMMLGDNVAVSGRAVTYRRLMRGLSPATRSLGHN